MPSLQTSFNIAPYFDDYDSSKNYYRILFKPGAAVQARELTQLQTILQDQIERFGDNIFKRGTIIEGCSLTYHSTLPYVKIKDSESDGTPVNVSIYENLYVKNSANVSAFIVKTIAGFEMRSPDLNTLYVKYNSSGNDNNTSTFSPDETLVVYDPISNIFKFNVIDGSTGFSNSDTIEVISSIAIQNSVGGKDFDPGSFSVNHVIQNGYANAIIVEANTTANSDALLLRIKPLPDDLKSANNVKWRFNNLETIRNANTGNSAVISEIIGSGAKGSIVTNSLGKIQSVSVVNKGSGYYYAPFVTASITSNSNITNSEISQLNIDAQNFLTTITISNTATNPVGSGYGITIDEGVIYQKGFFSKVQNQLIVVNKYSNTEFTKSVGFFTNEEIIDSNQDQSLLDNATGSSNYTAPGADRLKLIPSLYVMEKGEADSNTEFLPIVEFADGNPYKQNKRTVYNIIGDELARRTYEESGNYVLDQFILTTKDSTNIADSSTVFKINIDPGAAYIKGYKVETTTNYSANVNKGIDTINAPNSTIKIGYGSYVKVNQLGGIFQFNTGSVVDLYDTAKTYATSAPGSEITPAGNKIGQARIRSLILVSGEAGTSQATYNMYLFDIVMNSGKNFSKVKSIHYNGANKGIADIVVEAGSAILYDAVESGLVYKPVNAIKSANNITYTYRTIDQSKLANTTGYITITPGASENFPYTTTLNTIEERDLIIIPLNNYQASANAPGGITLTSGSANVTASGSMNFVNNFKPGDFIKFANSTSSVIASVNQVVNTTLMTLTSNSGSSITGNAVLYFPKNIPISLTSRSERFANVAANGQMTIYLGNNIANTTGSTVSANVAVVYNITATNVNPAAKTSNRGIFTRLRLANNAGLTAGPWALGVSDAFRLRKVYVKNSASTSLFANSEEIQTSNDFIKIVDNVFGDGDTVTYSTNSGNTVISGLSNNTLYYVVSANTTGFKLANTANVAQIMNITAGSAESGHKFTGQPIHFKENFNGVEDITNDFYIDNNQKEDYLDISYLYLKPRTANLSANDVLLVEYDAFTTGIGVKTISSYNINDSANLATLTATTGVNTLEIPEMVGVNGKYYDIRDQIDFRQASANTIPLTSNSSDITIMNPVEPSDLERFGEADQKFPAPNSTLSANITYYVARNDRVVLDKNGNFVVVKGVPNVLDVFPSEPKDSLTLQYLRIPPYPSLPFSLSSDTVNILDTKVANEKYGRRKDNFKVITPIDKNQRARIQNKNYTMSDIAKLEKRMKDLEYYVSFTLAETIAKSRFIPSGSNVNLDRYKFGFFVDPFTDYSFSDTNNPEYWSLIKDNKLLPKSTEFNVEFFFDTSQNGDVAIDSESFVTLPYIEYELIAQNDATLEYVEPEPIVTSPPTSTTPTPAPMPVPITNTVPETVTTVTQYIAQATGREKNTSRSDSAPYIFDEFFYTFSSTAGPIEFYMNHRDNNMATEFYQSTSSNGPWTLVRSSAAASGITQQDINTKGISSLNDSRKIENLGTVNRKSYGPAGRFIEDQHKILFNHNPTGGMYYKIRIYKGKNHGGQGKSGTYGYKIFYPTDTVTTTTTFKTVVTGFSYTGTVFSVTPPSFSLLMTQDNITYDQYSPSGAYVADSQKFTIEVSGLKPSTMHNFYFAGELQTNKCKQIRTSTTNTTGLLSDSNGYIKLDFYYDAGINEASSDISQQNKLLSSAAGVKSFSIQNADSSSYASGKIEIKNYATSTESSSNSTTSNKSTNSVTTTNEYDYTNNFGDTADYNKFSSTSDSDNITHVNWTGQSSYVSGYNTSGKYSNEHIQ